MKEIKPAVKNSYMGYFSVSDAKTGILKCSCGNKLEKLDDQTYRCPAGYPIYRFEDGTVVFDKFGNILIQEIPHDPEKDKAFTPAMAKLSETGDYSKREMREKIKNS